MQGCPIRAEAKASWGGPTGTGHDGPAPLGAPPKSCVSPSPRNPEHLGFLLRQKTASALRGGAGGGGGQCTDRDLVHQLEPLNNVILFHAHDLLGTKHDPNRHMGEQGRKEVQYNPNG